MKKWISLVCMLVLSVALASDAGIIMRTRGGAGCTPATDEVGLRTTGANTDQDIIEGYSIACLRTADCTGTLDTAYLYHADTGNSAATVCVYSDDGDDTPDVGDLKIGCSSGIPSGSSAGLKDDGGTIAGSVTATEPYWVIISVDISASVEWTGAYDTGQSDYCYYQNDTNYYTSPPANLGSESWSQHQQWIWTAYATIN